MADVPVVETGVVAGREPALEVAVGHDLVVYPVAVFLLFARLEQTEARGNEDGGAQNGAAVGKADVETVAEPSYGGDFHATLQ